MQIISWFQCGKTAKQIYKIDKKYSLSALFSSKWSTHPLKHIDTQKTKQKHVFYSICSSNTPPIIFGKKKYPQLKFLKNIKILIFAILFIEQKTAILTASNNDFRIFCIYLDLFDRRNVLHRINAFYWKSSLKF